MAAGPKCKSAVKVVHWTDELRYSTFIGFIPGNKC